MRLKGANPTPVVHPEAKLPGQVHHLLGNNSRQWQRDQPTYAKVRYRQVYPGIDLLYYGKQRELEYDFVVQPGADPRQIRLEYFGAVPQLDQRGDLTLRTVGGEVKQHSPVVYQEVNGKRQPVAGKYRLAGREVAFTLGRYDRKKPLVIDPVLTYSTYLGGFSDDVLTGVAVGPDDSIYVTGQTFSTNFPTQNHFQTELPYWDAVVSKFTASGTLVFSTYLGGDGQDHGRKIAVDGSGQACITGYTESTNFPLQNAFQGDQFGGDAFVTKLVRGGNGLIYSTYLGGDQTDRGHDIAVDNTGNAYVAGGTFSPNFPTLGAFQGLQPGWNAFITKIDPTKTGVASLLYSSYLGGDNTEEAFGINVDNEGSAYLTGYTFSADFPAENGAQTTHGGDSDGFVAKVAPSGGALVYSTYLGGSSRDIGNSIAVSSEGEAVVVGDTDSVDFPTVNPIHSALAGLEDAFVTRVSADGSELLFSTYLGGNSNDGASGVVLEEGGGIWVAGYTYSANFPTDFPISASKSDWSDLFVSRIGGDGSLTFSTYLGGGGFDFALGLARDSRGSVVVVGSTNSPNFPLQNPYQATLGGSGYDDGFITKLVVEPTFPSLLTATAVSSSEIYLTWSDNSENEEYFHLERRRGTGEFRLVRTLPADETEFLDRGLAPGISYTYRLHASTYGVFSTYSPTATATTLARLARPSNLTATVLTASDLRLNWIDNTTGEFGFEVQRRQPGHAFQRLRLVPANTVTYTDPNLQPYTKYQYRVRAYNGNLYSPFSNLAQRRTRRRPVTPTHLQAIPTSATTVTLTWTDRSSSESGFRVERASGASWVTVATTGANAMTYVVTSLSPATAYTFQVRAVSGSAVSGPSNSADATTQTAPPAPVNLQVTGVTSTSVGLSWQDQSVTETGFQVERSVDGVNYTVLTTRPAASGTGTTVTYTDTSVTAGTVYRYRIRAGSGSYASAPSNVVTASP